MIINNQDYDLRFTMLKAKIENITTNKEINALDEIYWTARVYLRVLGINNSFNNKLLEVTKRSLA